MKRDYTEGYKNKIKYWAGKYSEALNAGNWDAMQIAMDKLVYFNGRQCEWLEEKERGPKKFTFEIIDTVAK